MLYVTVIQGNDSSNNEGTLSQSQPACFTSCGLCIKNLTDSYISFCALVLHFVTILDPALFHSVGLLYYMKILNRIFFFVFKSKTQNRLNRTPFNYPKTRQLKTYRLTFVCFDLLYYSRSSRGCESAPSK